MAIEPLFSLFITPGSPRHLSQLDLGANRYVEVTGMSFMTACQIWLDDADVWPVGNEQDLFLEICRDSDAVAAGSEPPIWWRYVQKNVAFTNIDNDFKFFQPIAGNAFQFHLRHTAPYPGGTVFDNADYGSNEFSIQVLGHPPNFL